MTCLLNLFDAYAIKFKRNCLILFHVEMLKPNSMTKLKAKHHTYHDIYYLGFGTQSVVFIIMKLVYLIMFNEVMFWKI